MSGAGKGSARCYSTGRDEEAFARQRQEAEAALLGMPQLTRDIFIARRFHGLSIADICRQTGLSHGQVMDHLRRAVDHLCAAFPNGQSGQSRSGQALERARANGTETAGAEGGDKPPDPAAIAVMNSALMRLPRQEREVFLAMRVDHLSIEEIAAQMDLSRDEALRIFVCAFRNLERNLASPRRHWWRRWIGWPGGG